MQKTGVRIDCLGGQFVAELQLFGMDDEIDSATSRVEITAESREDIRPAKEISSLSMRCSGSWRACMKRQWAVAR